MKITLDSVFKITVLFLLVFILIEVYILKREMNDNLHEIDMVVSKLDYVEADINAPR